MERRSVAAKLFVGVAAGAIAPSVWVRGDPWSAVFLAAFAAWCLLGAWMEIGEGMKVKKREAVKIVGRVYRSVLRREPDKHAHSWVEMVRLGVFDEERLAKVFRLSSEYLKAKDRP